MTAEIAILNRTAVALAADSAVTIGQGENAKTYLSENKLFEISERKPIGVLIYNSLDFYGTPWEVLVKDFRDERGAQACSKVRDWTACFIEWLHLPKRRPSEQQQQNYLALYVREVLREIISEFNQRVLQLRTQDKKSRNKNEIDNILPAVIADKLSKVSDLKESGIHSKADILSLLNIIKDEVDNIENRAFGSFPLFDNERELLRNYVAEYLSREGLTRFCTGLVFAGFGDNEMFPSLHHVIIDGVFYDRARHFDVTYYDVDKNQSTGTIFAFAQPDVAERFLYGIDSSFEQAITDYYAEVVSGLAPAVSKELNLSASKQARLESFLKTTAQSVGRTYIKDAGPRMKASFFSTIQNMVRLMPKQEMADLAEALVNITIIKRRASTEMDTVGGPIDVAIISRHEGFVWVKRKFYFDPKLNARYFWRKFGIDRAYPGGDP